MKFLKTFSIVVALTTLFATTVTAQTPEGYTAGTITLSNGSTLNGYIKENFKKSACVSFTENTTAKKKKYEGWVLSGANINGREYICIKGDFFSVLTGGELYFLQKATNAEGKISYNGSDPTYINAIEGKAGSYYLYNSKTLAISIVDKSSYDQVVASALGTYQPAVQKANETKEDVAALKTAVELYNKRPAR